MGSPRPLAGRGGQGAYGRLSRLRVGRPGGGCGAVDDECPPPPRLRDDADRPAVRLDDVTGDGQPETRPLPVSLTRAVSLPEALEDAGKVLRTDADPRVAHHQLHPALFEEGTGAP